MEEKRAPTFILQDRDVARAGAAGAGRRLRRDRAGGQADANARANRRAVGRPGSVRRRRGGGADLHGAQSALLLTGQPVALGFEAPIWTPSRTELRRMTSSRGGIERAHQSHCASSRVIPSGPSKNTIRRL